MKKMHRIVSVLLVLCLVLTLAPAGVHAAQIPDPSPMTQPYPAPNAETVHALNANQPETAQPVTAEPIENPGFDLKLEKTPETLQVEAPYAPDEMVRVIVLLEGQGLLEQGYTTAEISSKPDRVCQDVQTMAQRQETVVSSIANAIGEENLTVKYHYNVAVNGVSLVIPFGALEEIQAMEDVAYAFVAPQYDVPEDMTGDTADPNLYSTKDSFGSALTWQTLGYSGEGMRIAIIDTGLDMDHPSFAQDPVLTENSLTKEEISTVLEDLNAYEMYKRNSSATLTADALYRSGKVPYAFNYVDENLDITHDNDNAGDHGTHVAGISAANDMEGCPVVGVAPEAQVIVMKVFGSSGGAYFDDILAALEDCYRLNVDAVNLSLGAPGGFTSEGDKISDLVYAQVKKSDMIASIAAGNSSSAALKNGYGTNVNLTKDPDNGIVSSPASYLGSTVVASLENEHLMSFYFTAGEKSIPYNDVAAKPFFALAGQEYPYVMVPGFGAAEDFEGLNLTGKIAVISRGVVPFTEKQINAANAGAIACIIYDNIEGALGNMQDAKVIPNIMITKASGEYLGELAVNGEGKLTPAAKDSQIMVDSPSAGELSGFSSWGVTPDLRLVPDVAAPGGNIYSTLDDGQYGTMSGTSMSAPHIAGMSALVFQYLRDTHSFPDAQAHTVAEALIMSTAHPMVEPTGVTYSPRKQGSGSANVYNAITSPGYLTVKGGTPKVSLGDDENRTGRYTFSFEVNNLTNSPVHYALDAELLTDQVLLDYAQQGFYFMGETSRNLSGTVDFFVAEQELSKQYDYNADGTVDQKDVQSLLDAINGLSQVKDGYDLNGDGVADTADAQALYELVCAGFVALDVVEVPANGSVTIQVTATLSEEDKVYLDTYYENGIYVDGFVRLYPVESPVELSLPFMGFYGSWSDARVFDSGWYWEGNNAEFNRYPNVVFTDFGGNNFYLGVNPYIDEPYNPAHNVLSPNGDGFQDKIDELYLGMMRGAKKLTFDWMQNDQPLFSAAASYVRKSCYNGAYGICLPFMYSQYLKDSYDFTDETGNYLPDGSDLVLSIQAYLDDGDEEADETMEIPVHIDTEAPVLYTDEMALLYNPYADNRYLEFYVSDNYDIAAVVTLTEAGDIIDRICPDGGEKNLIRLDVSDYDSNFVLAVCDYGCNETYYNVSFPGSLDVDLDRFYGYRRFSILPNGSNLYPTDGLNGWYSFEDPGSMLQHTSQYASSRTAVSAAEYLDGFIIGVDINSQIFAMKAGSWNRIPLGTLELNGTPYPALDMAYDYTTDTMYLLTDELAVGQGGHLAKLDYLTGEVEDLGVITGITNQGITLACDNDGVLYTVDHISGDLYTIQKENAKATLIGSTGYAPKFVQSMTVDHETNKLYWAAYQGHPGESCFFEVNKETAERTLLANIEHSSEMVGLFKPYIPQNPIYPEATLEAIHLSNEKLTLGKGRTMTLVCTPEPYYAPMNEVLWTSSNEAVATVDGGVVTAVEAGQATITATVGDLHVQCNIVVSAFDGALTVFDMAASSSWLNFNAAVPEEVTPIADATATFSGYTSAAYRDGWVYVCDYNGGFYRMDPATMQGSRIGSTESPLFAMAFNYADGFLYGIKVIEDFFESYYYLVRINPSTGELHEICQMDADQFGIVMGGMAIDYDGNFYCLGVNTASYETQLVKFTVEGDTVKNLQRAVLPDCSCRGYGSMLYSERNDGILWASDSGNLIWLNGDDMDHVKTVNVGSIGAQGGASMYMGLFSAEVEEPEVPYVEPTQFVLPESYLLLEGGQVSVGLSVEPWNAQADAIYSVKDPSIAQVDRNGILSGYKEGSTTLVVELRAVHKTIEVPITVAKPTGNLFGFLVSDFLYGKNMWIKVPDTNPGAASALTGETSAFSIYSGAYYNGKIYCYGQDQTGELNYKNYFLTVDAADYTVEVGDMIHYDLRDMSFDYTTGTMYAIAEGGTQKGSVAQLDLETGKLTIVADTGIAIASMTIDANGDMFAIGEDDNLYQIDKETGAKTLIGSVGINAGAAYQSMFYDYNTGNTYWAQVSENQTSSLRLVDLQTGVTTSLGMIAQNGAMMSALYTIPENEPAIPDTMNPTRISLDERNVVSVGSTVALDAQVLPVTQASMDSTLIWTSSDETIATVENGVVSGVTPGVVTITAATTQGITASCEVTVLEHERKFYAYDETNTQWISFHSNDTAAITVERDDAEGESPIAASAFTGDTIYSYANDGTFYRVDPETFERTLLGDGIANQVYMGEAYNPFTGETMEVPCDLTVVDLSFDEATGKLYVAVMAMNKEQAIRVALLGEVDQTTGSMEILVENSQIQPGNLLVVDGTAFFVDTFFSGLLTVIDLNSENPVHKQQSLVQGYWGDFADGRGFIRDPYTGTVYVIRDLRGGNSELNTFQLGDGHIAPIGEISTGIVANSLFLN